MINVGASASTTGSFWIEDDELDPALAPSEEALWPDEDGPLFDGSTLVHAAANPATVVDGTEDYRALGYPDARKLVRNSQGHLYAAYRKKVNNRYRIFVAESTDRGATWRVLNNGQPIEAVGDYTQRVPAIAIDNQDRLHLVWYGNDAANSNATNTSNEREIKYTRSSPTTAASITWTQWTNLYDGEGYDGSSLWQEHPTLYVNGTNVYVVWESSKAGKQEIKFLRSTDYGERWSAVVAIQPSKRVLFSRPTLVVSYAEEQRYLYVVAYGTKNGIARLFWTRSPDNGDTWDKWRPVAPGKTDQRHASVARDDNGRLHIVWRQVRGKQTILRYRVYDPAKRRGKGGWVGGPKTIVSVRKECLYFPSIAISGKNRDGDMSDNDMVWVVWTQSTDCTSVPRDNPLDGQIYLAQLGPNGKWSKPEALMPPGRHLYPTLRRANSPSSTAGNVELLWVDATGGELDVAGERVVCEGGGCVVKHVSLAPW